LAGKALSGEDGSVRQARRGFVPVAAVERRLRTPSTTDAMFSNLAAVPGEADSFGRGAEMGISWRQALA
jgi:hypothetical protein